MRFGAFTSLTEVEIRALETFVANSANRICFATITSETMVDYSFNRFFWKTLIWLFSIYFRHDIGDFLSKKLFESRVVKENMSSFFLHLSFSHIKTTTSHHSFPAFSLKVLNSIFILANFFFFK